MKIAAYNILKGGSKWLHWVKLIEDYSVDLLLVQESYAHDEHLPPLRYPDARGQSVWARAGRNGWGSAVFSRTGVVESVRVPGFSGWVVGAEVSGASWQAGLDDPLLVAVTGHGQEEDPRHPERAEIHLHLLKPVEPDTLLGLLRRFESVLA